MDRDYASSYELLYRRHWWWRAREELIVQMLHHSEPLGGFGTILDIGCGNGLFFERLKRFGVPEGIEPDGSIVTTEGRQRGVIYCVPFDRHFQPAKSYGLILMLDVLEHLPDALAALRHAASLLRPGGTLLLTVPAFNLLWTSHDRTNHHYTRYTRRSLEEISRRAGLQPQEIRYFFHWLFPVKLMVRIKEAIAGHRVGPLEPPREPYNRLLYRWCRFEQRLAHRMPPPFGSSLFARFESGRSSSRSGESE